MTIDADIRGPGVPLIRVHVDGEGTTEEAADLMDRTMTAREPDFKQGGLWCPSCGRRVFNAEVDAWCGHCGQRIKWEAR